ncbi:MAG: oligosaccharide flippase family protein [bacterium]|nr:oligosaccharide flippase family protein [bacterium]
MTDIRTVQVWGVLTKAVTAVLGILQTVIILRLLGPEAYGIVGIVVSLGALVGVSQHVGAVDAAIREIAVADTPQRRAAVFWVSLWFRLLITVPISMLLALAATWIGTRLYPFPEIPYLVRLMSLILVLHGVQGILGGAYTGQRAFGVLYVLQFVTAVLNVPLFAGLVWWRGINGFFEAVILAALVFSVLLAIFLRRALGGTATHPKIAEIRGVLADIIHTGAWTYVARILSVAWQRVPILLLGRWVSPEIVGLFTAATTFGSKLQLLAAALGEVNLAFLSKAFAQSREAFRRLAIRTLEDVGAVTLLGGLFLVLFARELVPILAGREYLGALRFIPAVTWAYAAFAFLDIASNTVFVPARRANFRAAGFGVMTVGTLVVMFGLRSVPETAVNLGLLAGALIGLATAAGIATARMGLSLFPRTLLLPTATAAGATFLTALPIVARVALFAGIAVWITVVAFPTLVRGTRRFFAPTT